jgi:3-hydroxyisobutyrate dehydrogenase
MASFSSSASSSSSLSSSASSSCSVGFIGTGVMGRYMAEHLMVKGRYESMYVYNRTASKAQPLVDKGAVLCESPRAVAEQSDVVFSIVGFPSDVEQVVLCEDTGVLAGLKEGGVFVDMTTSTPALAKEIYSKGQARGIDCIDAPVSGGDVGAKNATLSIMAGGDKRVFDRVLPLFKCMGTSAKLMGPASMGQHTKLTNQILIASSMVGVCEGMIYAHKAGLDLTAVLEAVGGGAAGSFSLNAYGPRIIARDFEPGFLVDHFLKDLGIALREAETLRLTLPGLAIAHQLYMSVKALSLEHKGTHALQLALEHMNNVDMGPAPTPREE